MKRPATERIHSVCPHDCPSTCALEVERLDAHTIGRVYGAKANGYTQGVICGKVGRYAERVHHPERLATPLRRVGAKGVGRAAFQAIGWDQALDETAERLVQAAQRHGTETVWPYFYAGTMGLVQRDGIERLRHVMKYSRQHSTFCTPLADAGWIAGTGAKRGLDPREMAEADLIVVWGGNPVHTQVNVMHYVSQARRARRAKFVVVDPYRTPTADKADIHLMPRPGTDGALCCAVLHVLFAEGYADRDYMARYTDAPEELERHVAARTPEWAARITGLSSEEIVEFARLYGRTRRSFIRIGYGFTRSRNGAVNMHAVSCLPAVTGAWQHPGGGALYANAALYHIDDTLIKGLDAVDPGVRVLDQSQIGRILCHDQQALGGGPPVTALFIQNTNPVVVAPESAKVREGFARDDLFVCVHEQFLTDTAAMADVVLPATTFLEHDDLYTSGGHTHLQLARKVIEPYAECRSNHWVLGQLAARLGASHPGFGMSEWELIDAILRASGHPTADDLAERHWLDCVLDFESMHYLNGFAHPDGKFRFKPDWAAQGLTPISPGAEGLPALPDHCAVTDESDQGRPFRLVAAPARTFLNTSFTETPSSRKSERRPTVKIHPDDCHELGVTKDDLVRLGNQRGSVLVHAEPFTGVRRGVLVVESLWDNNAFVEGNGINTLISADPGPPNGGAVFHDTAVWIERG